MTPNTPDQTLLAQRLRETLDALADAHESLLDVLRKQREAVRAADSMRLAECARDEGATLARLGELDHSRRELVARLASGVRRDANPLRSVPRAAELAQAVGGPEGEELADAARRLREVVLRTQAEARSLRAALRDLSAHARGLMAQVSRRLSHTGAYSRPGAEPRTPTVSGGVDITS